MITDALGEALIPECTLHKTDLNFAESINNTLFPRYFIIPDLYI